MKYLFQIYERAEYECTLGYKIEGGANDRVTANIRCTSNGWNRDRPNCERMLVFIS